MAKIMTTPGNICSGAGIELFYYLQLKCPDEI